MISQADYISSKMHYEVKILFIVSNMIHLRTRMQALGRI